VGLEDEQGDDEVSVGYGEGGILNGIQLSSAFLFCAQFCHNSKETVIACGGSQMKIFSLNDGAELLEVKVEEANVSLYTCDSGYNSNKYLVGGSTGTLFHFTGAKPYE
jgi:hypothetical protein